MVSKTFFFATRKVLLSTVPTQYIKYGNALGYDNGPRINKHLSEVLNFHR